MKRALLSYWSIVTGAVAGAALQVLETEMADVPDFSKFDWHQMWMKVGALALVALLHHWAPQPPPPNGLLH